MKDPREIIDDEQPSKRRRLDESEDDY